MVKWLVLCIDNRSPRASNCSVINMSARLTHSQQSAMVWKPGKHQRSKQRCQDLGCKVNDRAKSFVLRSYTMHGDVTNKFLLVRSSVRSKQLLCFVHGQGQKSEQNPTTKNFVGFHNHSPLLKSNGKLHQNLTTNATLANHERTL